MKNTYNTTEISRTKQQGLKRLINSFLYAYQGTKEVFKREQNIKIQLLISLAVVVFAYIFQISKIEFIFLLVVIAQVLSLETLNTALEMFLDRIEPNHDEFIGLIKDILAAAVLISTIFAIIVGVIIFWAPVLNLFR